MGEEVSNIKPLEFEALPGPQSKLFSLPYEVFDILYGGARGGGKSHGVLIHFWNEQQQHGDKVKGILFRRTYPELEDIIAKAKTLFISDGHPHSAEYLESKKLMKWSNGATLKFRFLEKDSDADKYQGHEYTWICIEEAGNFPSPVPIDKLRACLRSPYDVPKFILLTANPGGPGHNWLKSQYVDAAQPNTPHKVQRKIVFEGKETDVGWHRIFIPSKLKDNKVLMEKDPGYLSNVVASAGGQEWLLKAWLEGDWNIVAGGMFDDVWRNNIHILKRFQVPSSWRVHRAFDWGSSKPFSVGWWAISDGGSIQIDGEMKVFPPGTFIRIDEWYGWNGTPNTGLRLLEAEFVEQLKEKEKIIKKTHGIKKILNGPADSAIFTVQDGKSIADKHRIDGIFWEEAKKGPGSRMHAWSEIRQLLSNSLKSPMEDKGLFITENCLQFKRTIPVIQRDKKNLDDVDTSSEDHICDETGYMVRWEMRFIKKVKISGF